MSLRYRCAGSEWLVYDDQRILGRIAHVADGVHGFVLTGGTEVARFADLTELIHFISDYYNQAITQAPRVGEMPIPLP
jgi:hypothetical protein